jgi:3-isopropylmalate/(R)-2-methylmalate dehydratase small subunit
MLFDEVAANPGYELAVDLEKQLITRPNGETIAFEIDGFRKHCLLEGLDEIGLTMQAADKIKAFEVGHRQRQPWMFDAIK